MPVYDLYSKRRARELGQATDVFTYDEIPEGLRTQIIHIWGDAIGIPFVTPGPDGTGQKIRSIYQQIVKILRREYRVFNLLQTKRDPNDEQYAFDELKQWFLSESNTDRVLDAVEITARTIERICSRNDYIPRRRNSAEICKDAITELNIRFKESGVGYQYADGSIIRIDSQLIHTEAVIPALTVLRDPAFKNAQEEFLGAYEHFRHGNKEEALVDCCKCFESTMKVIENESPINPQDSRSALCRSTSRIASSSASTIVVKTRRGEASRAAESGAVMNARAAHSRAIIRSNGLDRPCMSSSLTRRAKT